MLSSFDTTGSALTATRTRLDVVANNIANVETTRTAEGGPYQRRSVVLQQAGDNDFSSILRRRLQDLPVTASSGFDDGRHAGVQVNRIVRDSSPFEMRHDPSHPDADEDGYVSYPNVDLAREMTDLMMANRTYQANASAFDINKSIMQSTLNMGR